MPILPRLGHPVVQPARGSQCQLFSSHALLAGSPTAPTTRAGSTVLPKQGAGPLCQVLQAGEGASSPALGLEASSPMMPKEGILHSPQTINMALGFSLHLAFSGTKSLLLQGHRLRPGPGRQHRPGPHLMALGGTTGWLLTPGCSSLPSSLQLCLSSLYPRPSASPSLPSPHHLLAHLSVAGGLRGPAVTSGVLSGCCFLLCGTRQGPSRVWCLPRACIAPGKGHKNLFFKTVVLYLFILYFESNTF